MSKLNIGYHRKDNCESELASAYMESKPIREETNSCKMHLADMHRRSNKKMQVMQSDICTSSQNTGSAEILCDIEVKQHTPIPKFPLKLTSNSK
jgi:hypothetical protein